MLNHLFFAVSVCLVSASTLEPGSVSDVLDRVEPAEAGFSPERLAELAEFLNQAGSSSMVILQDGKVVFEWGDIHRHHTVHSIRKALLNSLLGIAIEKGKIDPEQTLEELGINDQLGLTEIERSATIHDLLRQRSGVYHPAAAVSQGMLAGMPERGKYRPGEFFYYNNWDFNVLGAVYESATGQSIFEAFLTHIAQPLGMTRFRGQFVSADAQVLDEKGIPDTDGFYQYEREKSDFPAYHFRMSAHDLALYGQLYLQSGHWRGRQLVPRSWIEASTVAQAMTDPENNLGYGILWGVVVDSETQKTKAFYHTGTGVHMLGVYPQSGMVFVHRVATEGDYSFDGYQLYQVIGRVFAARIQ
jgi:CubicO group peptidase (beta-lactamase class C family)